MNTQGRALNSPVWDEVSGWTAEDSACARAQGWNIYAGPTAKKARDADPPFQIWRDDEAKLLKDDQAAQQLLRKMVKKNDPLALKARSFLEHYSAEEYKRVFHG